MRLVRGTFVLLGSAFLAVGVVLLIVVATMLAGDFELVSSGERADGTVIAAPDNGKPVVAFRTREGRQVRIEGAISTSPSPYEVGERIGVFYDPRRPDRALIDSFVERWFLALLFGGFATVFSLAGAGFLLSVVRRQRRHRRLLRHGLRLQGTVAGFEQVPNVKINGRRPWRVVVDWSDPLGQPRRERSEMLRDDPATRWKIGDPIAVMTDPDDINQFWIDLDGRSMSVQTGFGGTSGNVSAGGNVSGLGKSGTNPVVRRR